VVIVLGIELRRIGIGELRDRRDPRDARRLGVRVVEQDLVAERHALHEVARLIVAHAVPTRDLLLREVVDREHVRLRLHQPASLRHASILADGASEWTMRAAEPDLRRG